MSNTGLACPQLQWVYYTCFLSRWSGLLPARRVPSYELEKSTHASWSPGPWESSLIRP